MQFKLNRDGNNKLLINGGRSQETKLRILNLRGNKLQYPYNIRGLTAINPKNKSVSIVQPKTYIQGLSTLIICMTPISVVAFEKRH